ncbi:MULTISPECIES: DUF4064 domain-containing protein [Virgibacillus]|uniref:DUF4064 domain-containing protein n=1 Tax=Virgibacillus dokdonensis TaxID=302167 RepID=A0ABU7VJ55_9BACI|nr:DUF4064 domain-containing protein [Virgibacillus sp. Bac330]
MRTTEFVLGLIGGIFGFLGAILALFIGGVDAAFNETGSSDLTGLGWAAFLFSALAIVGAVVVKSKAKVGGVLLLISAIGGLISISLFYAISTILIGIAGLMALIKKDKEDKMAA